MTGEGEGWDGGGVTGRGGGWQSDRGKGWVVAE